MSKTRQGPGRPRGRDPDAVRGALLAAARERFAVRDFKAVSVRELAHAAGVNPAMVAYYFGDKRGLYEAMVQESVGPLLAALESAEGRGETVRPGELLGRYVATLAANPWLPNLVVREVLYGDGAFRDVFVERFARRVADGLVRGIEAQGRAGTMRTDVDPSLLALALISLAVFPFLARPVVEPALGLTIDDVFAERWAREATRLLDPPGGPAEGGA